MPQPRFYIKTLRKAYETFKSNGQINDFIITIQSIGDTLQPSPHSPIPLLKRTDLKLICFDYIWT